MRMIFMPEGHTRSLIGSGWLVVPEAANASGRAKAFPAYTLNYLGFRTVKGTQ